MRDWRSPSAHCHCHYDEGTVGFDIIGNLRGAVLLAIMAVFFGILVLLTSRCP